MRKLAVYVHGKGGNATESEHYKPLLPEYDVIGFDYKSETRGMQNRNLQICSIIIAKIMII